MRKNTGRNTLTARNAAFPQKPRSFALDKARKSIADTQTALIVEGQIDAIRCHSAGLKNVVASQGTALTSQHAKLLSRYADEVVLILDADDAGENAALKSIEAFLTEELSVRVCTLPEGEDPDSLIKKDGAEILQNLVKNAPDAIDFQINVLGKREDLTNNAALMRVVKEVQHTLSLIKSSVLRDKLTEKAADRLGISAEALKRDVRAEFINRPKQEESPKIVAPIRKRSEHPIDEKELCKIVAMFHDEVLSLVADYISPMHFTDIDCRKIYEVLLHRRVDSLMNELHAVSENCLRLAAEIQATPDKNVGEFFKKEEEAYQLMLSIIRKNATIERNNLKQQYGDEMPESVQRRRLELTQIINAKTWQAAVKFLEPLH